MLEMLEELANHFRENGYPNIRRICADAAVDNPKVLINLKKLGFSIESHTKDAFAAGRHAGYSLFKELTPRIIKSLGRLLLVREAPPRERELGPAPSRHSPQATSRVSGCAAQRRKCGTCTKSRSKKLPKSSLRCWSVR